MATEELKNFFILDQHVKSNCHNKTDLSICFHYLTLFLLTNQFCSYIPGCSEMFSFQSEMAQLLFFQPLVLLYLRNTKETVTCNISLLSTRLKPTIFK